MERQFKRETKYEVFKLDDARKYLSERQQHNLVALLNVIQDGRKNDGKPPCNRYVVVNEDEWYSETVWKLIEAGEILKK